MIGMAGHLFHGQAGCSNEAKHQAATNNSLGAVYLSPLEVVGST